MGPKPDRLNPEDLKIVRQANLLLEQLNAGSTLSCVEDINAAVYVTLFEGLCGEKLAGVIRTPLSKEDEIQNVQVVIDILSRDILHTSLAHISGRDIVEGNRESISNLLEIFSGLLQYILNKIESDVSTDGEENEKEDLEDDPDAVQADVIDKILERELRRNRSRETSPEVHGRYARGNRSRESSPEIRTPKGNGSLSFSYTPEKISLATPKKSLSETEALIAMGNEEISDVRETTTSTNQNSTNELIREGEKLEQELESDRYRPGKTAQQVREDIARHRRDLGLLKDPFEDLVPVSTLHKPETKSLPPGRVDQRSESYNSLCNMVEETAAMAKEAVDCSPNRARTILRSLENDQNRHKHYSVYHSPKKGSTYSPPRKTKSPIRPCDDEFYSENDLTPSKAKRKVSFLVERSTTSESSPSFLRTSPRYRPKVKSAWEEKKESPKKSVSHKSHQDNTQGSRSSYSDFDRQLANLSYDEYLKKQFHEIIDEVLSDDEAMPPRFRSRSDQKKIHTSKLGSKSKGNYSVTDTQKLLDKERDTNKRKVDFLQKIYQEDLDELQNEAEYDLSKERKDAKHIEDEFKKKVMTGPKKTIKSKEQGATKKKTPTHKPTVCSKVKRKSPGGITAVPKQKLTIKDDEDILPMLLKEFPHLHLSLHTWHELWRKGINQIEQVSRVNQEVRRKKSKAKAELEEAEKRHEIMVNIMKKEMEHGRRMKEIKERHKQTVVAKNLIQEKRSQSARSRKYYDDYQVRMRSKMLKRRTREEMIFTKLFRDGLDIQKDRVRELKKYAKEQREAQAVNQRNEIESMENYYRDQFEMLAESITKERQEVLTREKAQQKVLQQMKKELRKKMESEIKMLQDQLVRDDDDAYFRQLDADRVIHNLQLAKYHVNV